MAQIQYRFNADDEYATPVYAVYSIMRRLKEEITIWCLFDVCKFGVRKYKLVAIHGNHSVGQNDLKLERRRN